MEENGLVISKWDTQEAGAAKRMYTITEEGRQVLVIWIRYMTAQAEKLKEFISMYRSAEGE